MGFVFGEVDTTDVTAPFSTAITPNGSASIGSSSTLVTAANASRKLITIVNASDTDIYLCLSTTGAAVGTGIYLKAAGGSWTEAWAGAVCAITATGSSKILTYVEY